jgi:hypothetical protein
MLMVEIANKYALILEMLSLVFLEYVTKTPSTINLPKDKNELSSLISLMKLACYCAYDP